MMLRPIVLLVAISLGGWAGWALGSPGGLMTAYLAGVAGASLGLFVGRRLQRNMDGD